MRIACILTATLLIFLNYSTKAQMQFSAWLASFNTIKTGKKTSLHAETQFRSFDKFIHLQNTFVRGGINYHLAGKKIITAGYGYFRNKKVMNNISGYASEHRIWQQFIINHNINRVQTSHRFRLEQRFIEKTKVETNDLKNDGFAYTNRFRYFIRNVLPLSRNKIFSKGAFVALQNEIFVNIGNTSAVNGNFLIRIACILPQAIVFINNGTWK